MRLTAAQALVRFLARRSSSATASGAGSSAAASGSSATATSPASARRCYERPDLLRFIPARNEQAMVHAAVGYARQLNRLGAFVCTSSIGPGATNMVTGAALATVNRLPVLLVPGDVFASRLPDPVLQQLEVPGRGDVSVNDCFVPVSRYFDRIERPEQVIPAALAAMRTLTSPAETGAVTLAFPQDVQAEAFDVPEEFLAGARLARRRVRSPTSAALRAAVAAIRARAPAARRRRRRRHLLGGDRSAARVLRATGIPVGETQAGKGSLPYDHPRISVRSARRARSPRTGSPPRPTS